MPAAPLAALAAGAEGRQGCEGALAQPARVPPAAGRAAAGIGSGPELGRWGATGPSALLGSDGGAPGGSTLAVPWQGQAGPGSRVSRGCVCSTTLPMVSATALPSSGVWVKMGASRLCLRCLGPLVSCLQLARGGQSCRCGTGNPGWTPIVPAAVSSLHPGTSRALQSTKVWGTGPRSIQGHPSPSGGGMTSPGVGSASRASCQPSVSAAQSVLDWNSRRPACPGLAAWC